MATWSEENLNKIKNVLQARGQASQNLAQGGQLLQQGIGQLGQGVTSGLDFLQTARTRRSQEEQANLERAERSRQFDEGLGFNKDTASGVYSEKVLERFGAPKNLYNRTVVEFGHEPKGYGDKEDEKEDDFFADMETGFSGLAAMWADENTLKGRDGKSIVSTEGRISDWSSVDFDELQKRFNDFINYNNPKWTNGQKKTALEYSTKWINYRMRQALNDAGGTKKPDELLGLIKNWADAIFPYLPAPNNAVYEAIKSWTEPPKSTNEVISKFLNLSPGTALINQLLKYLNGNKQPNYTGIIPVPKKKEEEIIPQRNLPLLESEFFKKRPNK
jgi:hypothetical protein